MICVDIHAVYFYVYRIDHVCGARVMGTVVGGGGVHTWVYGFLMTTLLFWLTVIGLLALASWLGERGE